MEEWRHHTCSRVDKALLALHLAVDESLPPGADQSCSQHFLEAEREEHSGESRLQVSSHPS